LPRFVARLRANEPSTVKRSTSTNVAVALALGAIAWLAVACAAPQDDGQAHAASPERQSLAEYDLARDAFGHGRLREALDHTEKALKLDDSNVKALYFASVIYMGFCYTESFSAPDCRLDEAEQFARRAMSADDQFRDARNTLGQVLILEKKYSEAIRVLEPLTKDPAYVSSSLAWGNYGWAEVLSGRVDDGIVSLRNSITDPRFCVGHYRLGMAYEKKNDLVAAERSFTDAVQVQSPECQNLQDAWFERGRVRLKLGNSANAQADFARCRDIGTQTDTGKECAKLAGNTPAPAISVPAAQGSSVSAPSASAVEPAPR
jgi:type IV pilus assembly protein PilF